MSCPTCDHTMQGIGVSAGGDHIFWCPRCGTLRRDNNGKGGQADDVPSLPHRVKAFIEAVAWPYENIVVARKIGLEESCTLPANRKLG